MFVPLYFTQGIISSISFYSISGRDTVQLQFSHQRDVSRLGKNDLHLGYLHTNYVM